MKKLAKADIANYLRMCDTPAGAILGHIIHNYGLTQRELSRRTGIRPQHVNALISGARRFSATTSLFIEKALEIDHDGFFYICQCNHDISEIKKAQQKKPDISKLRKATFWDVNLALVDWQKGKRWAILRVLEYGTQNDFDEIVKIYGVESFRQELSKVSANARAVMLSNAKRFGL